MAPINPPIFQPEGFKLQPHTNGSLHHFAPKFRLQWVEYNKQWSRSN